MIHVQSRRNLLKYLVRVKMASDWFTRIYRSILAEEISSKIETRLRAQEEPAIRRDVLHKHLYMYLLKLQLT